MEESAGQANITVITVVLIGIVLSLGLVLVPKLSGNTIYISCCNAADGLWKNGYCVAKTPTTCDDRETMFSEFDKCVIESGKHNANEKYRAVSCE